MLAARDFVLTRHKMLAYLATIAADASFAATRHIPAGALLPQVHDSLRGTPEVLIPEITERVVGSSTGAVLFRGGSRICLVLPPFPIAQAASEAGGDIASLCAQLTPERTIGVVLIRLGAYAIGLCHGEDIVNSKVGTGLVHGRHRQGGSSSHRFVRHREKQIEYFLTRVCGHTREILEPGARDTEYLVYGGSNTAILLLQKQCHFLEQFRGRELSPLLTLHEPRRATLSEAIGRIWSSRVIEWREENK
ncbi:MAG: Vms1/Ankzf1 family peptidyl-tRNA hydrolase [Dehalococcoidales bacterium]|nr:Vms1/Ankzf1 family peptidyl-tRNA hydrolase [Dehalococcoidales bacterium]